MTPPSGPSETDRQRRVDEAVAQFLESQAAGGAPDPEAWLAAHADLTPELSEFLSDLRHLQGAMRSPPDGRDEVVRTTNPTLEVGQRTLIAGRYTLIERIGSGGMGEVWMARQSEPVHRKVAVKLIKAGMDSASVSARFEAERQALAMMDHPNIANVLDGGVTLGGRPFFVMELVNGLPLTKFCDDAKLTPRERLELFVPICQAVQHAHHKGIVHRDLKPSNILVTLYDGRPVPKIIDFGVAKAIGGKLTAESLSTEFGAVVGTLEYMSPEQAGYSGLDVDARADIYSLGVLLYELLTGLRPIDADSLQKAALGHMLRLIQEHEPSRPSARLSTDKALPSLAALRGTEPKRLTRLLRGELDCIVMKCLEKDRNRRYETANSLSQDVQRYLADEPVLARPPSTGYRLRKFVRRNKAAVLSASLVVASLVAAVVGTSLALVRTRAAERQTKAEARKAMVVRNFLANDLLRQANPDSNARSEHVSVEELLDRASEALERNTEIAQEPDVEFEIRAMIADTYEALGNNKQAARHWDRALHVSRDWYGPEDQDHTLVATNGLGLALIGLDRLREAEGLLRQTVAVRRRLSGSADTETLFAVNNLGLALGKQGRLAEAEPLLKENYETRAAVYGPRHWDTLEAMCNYAKLLEVKGDYAASEAIYRRAVDGFRAQGWDDRASALSAANGLGTTLVYQGKLDEAERLFVALIEQRLRLLGPTHTSTLGTRTNLSYVLMEQGKVDDAVRQATLAYEGLRSVKGTTHSETLSARNSLVLALRAARRWDEAERQARELVDDAERHPAAPMDVFRFVHNLGWVYEGQGKFAEAEQAYHRALAIAAQERQEDNPAMWSTAHNLADMLLRQEKAAAAAEQAEAAFRARQRLLRPGHPGTLQSGFTLARSLTRLDRLAEAEAVAVELIGSHGSPADDPLAMVPFVLGHCRLLQSRAEESIEPLRSCLQRRRAAPVADWLVSEAESELAAALTQTSQFEEAEQLLLHAAAQLAADPDALTKAPNALPITRGRLVALYEVWDRPGDAARWSDGPP